MASRTEAKMLSMLIGFWWEPLKDLLMPYKS